jgi:hypothetical protein
VSLLYEIAMPEKTISSQNPARNGGVDAAEGEAVF